MENENVNMAVNLINGEFKSIIEKAIKKHFGVSTDIIAEGHTHGNIEITDKNTDVSKKMTSNKLLQKIFKNANLKIFAWQELETNNIFMRVHVFYTHTNGGFNGKELGKLILNINNKKIKYSVI